MKEKTDNIDILEELANGFDNLISYKQKQAIKTLIAEYKELKEENFNLKQQKIIDKCSIPNQDNFYDCYNYIEKSKVEEVKEKIMYTLKKGENVPVWKIVMTDNFLQSLLGKE